MARELAQDGTWRRLLTDPTGQVSEVGTVTYRPGADLTRTVIARDVTCTFPGCRQPASRCDLDHIVPVRPHPPRRDPDLAENLHALCRHHHQAKTKKHWNVHRNPTTGVTWWTSADGITYARHPTPLLIDFDPTHHATTRPPSATTPTTRRPRRPRRPRRRHPRRSDCADLLDRGRSPPEAALVDRRDAAACRWPAVG